MILKDYKQNKKQVLAIFDEYARLSKAVGKEVDESIKEQADKIKNEIFNLMILGEAKAGSPHL